MHRASPHATLLSFMSVLMTLLGAVLPISAAGYQTQADKAITITLGDSGTFALALTTDGSAAISRNTNATSPPSTVLNINMRIDISDHKAYRAAFTVWMSASRLTSNVQIPGQPEGTFYQFPADALWIHNTRHAQPGRCDYPVTEIPNACSGTPQHNIATSYPIGDLWALDKDGNTVTPPHPTSNDVAALWTTPDNPSRNSYNTLDIPRRVTQGDAGAGTLDSQHSVYLGLSIPGAMPAGVYSSTITITTVPPGP